MHSLNRKGFTLIELLVVIAIIAILAAILFPVFAQAKEAAKKAADLSNSKQINLGVQMYMGDYDDVFPMLRNDVPRWASNVTGPQVNSGHIAVNPYVKNKQVWRSPNDSMPRCDSNSTGYSTSESHATGGALSYVFSYNSEGLASRPYGFGLSGWDSVSATTGKQNANWSPSKSGTAVGSPGNTIYLIPSYISWTYWNGLMQHRNDQREYAFEAMIPTWPKVISVPGVWCGAGDAMSVGSYGGVTNWGFADGHVKTMKRNQIMDAEWYSSPATAITNNRRNLIHVDERFHN